MARRRASSALQNVAGDPRVDDESPELWREDLGDVARTLLTSAVRCFARNGYHATTTRDISTGAGLSPAALYVHFPSKENALYEIIRSAHESALAYIGDPAVADIPDVSERLRVIVSRYTAWHARHHIAARVSQYDLAALTPQHYEEILKIRHRTNEVFRVVLSNGIAEGIFPNDDVNKIVRAILSLGIDVVRWYRLDGPDSPEQLGDFYADLALRMVTNNRTDLAATKGPLRSTASVGSQPVARLAQ